MRISRAGWIKFTRKRDVRSDITILITTFLRPGYLRECLRGIRVNLPECDIAIACDDDVTHVPPDAHVSFVRLPFDRGLCAKRNAAVKLAHWTKYCLLGCDDFDFSTPAAREGIFKMKRVLEEHPDVDVVVGTYNGKRYEGDLEYVPGEYIREHLLRGLPYCLKPYPIWKIDIGVNYFLARTRVLEEVPWDESIRPIGGEHGDWFLSMKEAGKSVVFIKDCHITTLPDHPEWRDPLYPMFRRRAYYGHEIFLKKRNIKNYYGFNQ